MKTVQYDLHGCYPEDIRDGLVERAVKQAWEMGADALVLIHGHGRDRAGWMPRFVHTNTGYLGLKVRAALQVENMRQWVRISTLDRRHDGSTTIKLKSNPSPTRTSFNVDEAQT